MKNSNEVLETKHIVLPPPPPPLPPPPSFHETRNSKKLDSKKQLKLNWDNHSLNNEYISVLPYISCTSDSKIISFYKHILPVLQDGPSCGIVALSMASQYFKIVDASEILTAAKQLKFSKSGEIFSAPNMATLASTLLNCDVTVINNLKSDKDTILSHICSGWPVLVPYDADKNHEPCLNNGKSAHWAVLSGLCFAIPNNIELEVEYKTSLSGLKICDIDNGLLVNKLLKYGSSLYVYAHQGKSKHVAVWDLEQLLLSNSNLYEVTKKYEIDELVLPRNDILSELRDKAVLLKR